MTSEIRNLRLYNISILINFHQNRFINECTGRIFLKFSELRKDEVILEDVEELTFLIKSEYLDRYNVTIF